MNIILKNQIEKTFAMAISEFKDQSEAILFLKDFLTEKEFSTLSKRLSVIYLLTKKRSYSNVQNNLKVSSATIAEGKELAKKESIMKIIRKIDADEWAEKWSFRIRKLWNF